MDKPGSNTSAVPEEAKHGPRGHARLLGLLGGLLNVTYVRNVEAGPRVPTITGSKPSFLLRPYLLFL